jgi:glutathione synthase/RimK-type ligase-like ATP-grasp enzyme
VIVVWGALDDDPVVAVLEALDDGATEVMHVDDDDLQHLTYDIELGPVPTGWFGTGSHRARLDEIQGWYVRPGRRASPAAMVLLAAAGGLPSDTKVVNRPAAAGSNHSKPYQGTLIAEAGLCVPDTLVTSDAVAGREFVDRHGRVVVKSISGVRSVVAEVGVRELDRIGHGPVQLQQHVEGLDVRVHVIGDEWYATSIESGATDYRYGGDAVLAPIELPTDLGSRLVDLTARLGLLLAGVDLRRTPAGGWYCFEVNPSPGFTYYEAHTGQPIADAIARLLRSEPASPSRP